MKEFSIDWIRSTQVRKQRKYRYNAPMHVRRKLISVHLEKTLRKEYGRRALPVRKEDEVKIMRGAFAGTRGKVTRVDLKALKVYIDNAKRKKVSGQEVEVPIDPSNLLLTKINIEDKKRKKFIVRKQPKNVNTSTNRKTPEGRQSTDQKTSERRHVIEEKK